MCSSSPRNTARHLSLARKLQLCPTKVATVVLGSHHPHLPKKKNMEYELNDSNSRPLKPWPKLRRRDVTSTVLSCFDIWTFVFRLVCQFCSFSHDAWPKNFKRSLLEKKKSRQKKKRQEKKKKLNTLKKKTRAEGLVHNCLFPLHCLCLCYTGNRHNSLCLILFYSIACFLIAFVSFHRKQAQ